MGLAQINLPKFVTQFYTLQLLYFCNRDSVGRNYFMSVAKVHHVRRVDALKCMWLAL
jgi:hypothetical protein